MSRAAITFCHSRFVLALVAALALVAGPAAAGQAAADRGEADGGEAASIRPVAGKPAINLGADPTGRVCSARRLFGDPLLRDGRRDFAYDVTCGRSGSIGRLYLLGSRSKDVALREWRDAIAPLCVAHLDSSSRLAISRFR